MSHRAIVHVAKCAPEHWSPSVRLVALIVAEHVNDADGLAWPGTARLARLTGLGERSVLRALSTLEADGAIARTTTPYVPGGGRQRVIEWRFWPIGPGLRVVDNGA